MKKKYIFVLLAAVTGLASCDMDKVPYDSIPDTEALQTPTDFSNMREGLYTGLRSTVGSEYSSSEIQCDGFNGTVGFNMLHSFYNWNFTTSEPTFGTVYGNYQSLITRANFLITGYDKCDMSNTMLFTDDAKTTIKNIKGEAFFTRAYSIFMLSQFFCADYDAKTASQPNTGVSYRLDYAPSSDHSTHPGRNTLAQTYTQIKSDLDSAAAYITTAGAPSSHRISVDAITALRARVALASDDYAEAAKQAESLIASGNYTLAASADDMNDLWHNDGGKETIVQLAVGGSDELPTQVGYVYLPYTTESNPDFIPTKDLVDLYSDKDYRKAVYFAKTTLTTSAGTTGEVMLLNKYTDQGKIWQDNSKVEDARFCIEPKMFRIAEMYLIAAEGYAKSGNLTKAAQYLNDLESKRIADYQTRSFASADALMLELKKEREREMVAEGSRLFDLKRWHEPVKRGTPQQLDLTDSPGQSYSTALSRPANDNKLTWPIPLHEMNVNGKMVQNPGW